jgi:hypothetical protein
MYLLLNAPVIIASKCGTAIYILEAGYIVVHFEVILLPAF